VCWGEAQELSSIHSYRVRVREGLLNIREHGGTETQAPAISGLGALKQGGLSTRRIMCRARLVQQSAAAHGCSSATVALIGDRHDR